MSEQPSAVKAWHAVVESGDPALLDGLLADDVVFRSPAVFAPQEGKDLTALYLRSEDRGFFRPLADLEPGDARVFLGIVLPIDGVPGLQRRHTTASRYLPGFGVAMYCGFGRQRGADGTETMREHAHVVRAVRGGSTRNGGSA